MTAHARETGSEEVLRDLRVFRVHRHVPVLRIDGELPDLVGGKVEATVNDLVDTMRAAGGARRRAVGVRQTWQAAQ
jgi:hypothetical protein